jgi:thioredoxin-dependent peroxiredoxin
MTRIQVSDRAPDFTATVQDGRQISMADFRGKQGVVLYFYPRDETPICTREACAFRDAYQDFTDAGVVVIGVSSDGEESHRAFAGAHQLPFLLVADVDGSLRQKFGVPKTLGFLPGRVTYVIDRAGIVRHIFNAQFQGKQHVDEALRTIRQLNESMGS